MDRLHAMTTFVSVVDQGGFTQAARRLKVSPSAVTRSIAALEEHLGARLLQRTTRSVTLTDVGSRYLVRARQILADVHEAEESAQAERSAPTGHLVIAAPVVFGRQHVAPVVCAYLSRHPEVSCELTLGDRNVNLVEDGVDAAVRIGRQDDTTLVSRAIGATRRVLVASPGYLDARGAPESLADLADHDTIQFNPRSTAAEWRLTEGGEARRRLPADVSTRGLGLRDALELLAGALAGAAGLRARGAMRHPHLAVHVALLRARAARGDAGAQERVEHGRARRRATGEHIAERGAHARAVLVQPNTRLEVRGVFLGSAGLRAGEARHGARAASVEASLHFGRQRGL